MAHSRLSDPEYKNWITVGQAMLITRDGLESIVQNAVDKYHTSLLSTLRNNVHTWKNHLTTAHRSGDKKRISWWNSDDTQWLTAGASWEIAKIFMAPLGPRKLHVVNAQTTDISGLLNVLEWSPVIDPRVNRSKVTDARSARNIWAHAPQLHISDADKAKAFTSLTSLLQDPELCGDKDVQDAINELNKLLSDGLVFKEEKELELLVELQHQLGLDIVSLKSDRTYWKDQVDANLKQIQNLKKSLDKFVKKNELEKRMDEFEKQIRSTNIRLEKLEENASSEPEQFVCDGKTTLKFNPVCDRMKEQFVGREWLFSDIDSWLERDLGPRESRAFSIRGGHGTGKSSIARELVRRQEGKKLAGYHYFQKDNPRTYDLELLVDNLHRMLSDSLPAYAALVGHSYLEDANKFRNYPEKLFHCLITTPLQQLQENNKRFLLIGALDEGGPIIASCFARMSATLPPWLRVIFTATKNATALFYLFPECTCANLDLINPDLQPKTSHIKEDMREFVTIKHRKLQTERHNDIPPFFKNNTEAAIEKIVDASKSCFLYAKLVMEHIFAGHDIRALPSTLSEMYCLDFRRLFPDEKYFETNVAPILEVVLATEDVNSKIINETFMKQSKQIMNLTEQTGILLVKAVETGCLSGITKSDLDKALKKLSGYLFQTSRGAFYFSHVSVRMWLQEKKSDYYCDVYKGHSTMTTSIMKLSKKCTPRIKNSQVLLARYLSHSSFCPGSERIDINSLALTFGIKVIEVVKLVLVLPKFEDLVMKIINETDVLDESSLEEKAECLATAIWRKYERVAARLINSANWIFSLDFHRALTYSQTWTKSLLAQNKGSLPQLLFSTLCGGVASDEMIQFCVKQGVKADVCVSKFFKNTENFNVSICWNENVQEYFRKLKTGETNIVTLESLKENPSFPDEARIDDYTLKIIQKPISEVERLVKEGECYVCFTYGWHVMALTKYTDGEQLDVIDMLLKHGADVNNRGNLGKTALMMACESQNRDLISFLLDHGAKVNEQDFYGSTALHHTLERKESSEVQPNSPMQVDIIDMLLEHEADPHLKNSRGVSAIDIAEQEGGIVLEKLTGKRRRRDGLETDQDTL